MLFVRNELRFTFCNPIFARFISLCFEIITGLDITTLAEQITSKVISLEVIWDPPSASAVKVNLYLPVTEVSRETYLQLSVASGIVHNGYVIPSTGELNENLVISQLASSVTKALLKIE